jgi:hypothetical protein
MSSVESVQKRVQGILSLEANAPKPPTSVCLSIQSLKDLIELEGVIHSGWRKTLPVESGGAYRLPTSSSVDSFTKKAGGFRGGAAPVSANNSPISRVSSTKSFGDGSLSPTSPLAPPPIPKYQSKFKNSSQPVDDKIINVIILSKLNKFSQKTYAEIRDFLYQILGSGEPDLQQMIRDFMKLVFKKAALEEIFCPLYAKLLCEISSRYTVILQEMNQLQSNYLKVFDDIAETANEDYNDFVESQKNKQFRLGYSQFLAELSALEILDLGLLNTTFQKILSNMLVNGKLEDKKTLMEEYCDCLSRMAKVLKKKYGQFFVNARATLYRDNGEALERLIAHSEEFPSETPKTRFILMDIRDILMDK